MKRADLKKKRRIFQITVAIAFILIPVLNRSNYSMVYGNFLSFHAFGIPFADPLAVLQLTIKNLYFTWDNFVGAMLPLVLAFALGTVFCSWVCPYGLLSELAQSIRKKSMPGRGLKRKGESRSGFLWKIAIFSMGFIVFFFLSTTPVLNQLSTAAWYSRFFQYAFGQDVLSLCFLFILGLLAVEYMYGQRLWCRYVCPQSVLIILAKQANHRRLRVVFDQEKCICKPGYERCEMACSLNLQPKSFSAGLETECSNCGDCVVACKKMGSALRFDSFLRGAWPATGLIMKYGGLLLILSLAAGIIYYSTANKQETISVPPAAVDGSVTLTEYGGQVFVLSLLVNDPSGIIKKIETSGTHIGMETMLTSVKKWINSPEIIVSEGSRPDLPFTTHMKIIFHDGHSEELTFETTEIIDKSSVTFSDPWF